MWMLFNDMIGMKLVMELSLPHGSNLRNGLLFVVDHLNMRILMGSLSKFVRLIVLEYQSLFERLSNRAKDWSERQLVGTFIEGLNSNIHCEVKACQPRTMTVAIFFARLYEEKINMKNRRTKSVNRQVTSISQLLQPFLIIIIIL